MPCSHSNPTCALARQGAIEVHTEMCPREAAENDQLHYAEELSKAEERATEDGNHDNDEVKQLRHRLALADAAVKKLYR